MFGNLLSSVVKVVTLPIDVANIVVDKASGGDGSKQSRNSEGNLPNPISFAEQVRDEVADTLKDIDD